MKRTFSIYIIILLSICTLHAEDGSRLWLRYPECRTAEVTGHPCIAADVLRDYFPGRKVTLQLHTVADNNEAYQITGSADSVCISSGSEPGLLYGAFALLRGERGTSVPAFQYRLLNHWDNLDGTIERGYAGQSIFWHPDRPFDASRIKAYALANASIGINGTVLNNVNASPRMLTTPYLRQVRQIADLLRPYGIKVYLSINFATPMALGATRTADPTDRHVVKWWKRKVKEIYQLIPDFGGFLVKANSEGQPGPSDYGRSHAEGANMLADALQPYGGIVMWRCFVYGANHKGEDRVKQAVSEFKPLDGQFRANVILQTKNGPLDFQPREPYSPIFDQIKQTPNMAELQITQEYLGQSRHLVYLAPMWKEFFAYVPARQLKGIAGVANIGDDTNWCGHHFSQANWYAFGRLAWNPQLLSIDIAKEWLAQTFSTDRKFIDDMAVWMETSREACVNYMMPLGLHHIFKFDHHYGPEPDGFKADYPLEWCPVYYHQATKDSIGFDRTTETGTDAVSQYKSHIAHTYNNIETCPEELLLWFHRVPWTHRMKDGSTLWESLQYHYNSGVIWTESLQNDWRYKMRHFIDKQRWLEVDERLQHQVDNARQWRDVCLDYFRQFAE